MENNEILTYYRKKWYPESFYLLAMLDYLSRVNNVPLCDKYNKLRQCKLKARYGMSFDKKRDTPISLSSIMKEEQHSKDILINFQEAYPHVTTTSNVDDILKSLKTKQSTTKQRSTTT